jgi:hypothetical protein
MDKVYVVPGVKGYFEFVTLAEIKIEYMELAPTTEEETE